MDTTPEKKIDNHHNHRIAAGVILIIFGAATLLQHWLNLGDYIILSLGLGFGLMSHRLDHPGRRSDRDWPGHPGHGRPLVLSRWGPERCFPDLFCIRLVPYRSVDQPVHLYPMVGARPWRHYGCGWQQHPGYERGYPLGRPQPGLCHPLALHRPVPISLQRQFEEE
jgi:hypothetical protein